MSVFCHFCPDAADSLSQRQLNTLIMPLGTCIAYDTVINTAPIYLSSNTDQCYDEGHCVPDLHV